MAYNLPFFILVKETYKHPVFKILLKMFHLFPVARNKSAIENINNEIKNTGSLIVLAPEGTRKKTNGWKTGFHYFAKTNKMRILPSYVCYKRKYLIWGEPFEAESTPDKTIEKCKQFYDLEKPEGLYPENTSPIKIIQ